MRPTRARRQALAIPIVVALLAAATMGMMAAAYFRGTVTRNLDAVIQTARALRLAEDSLVEVAHMRRLDEYFADTANRDRLVAAFQNGEIRGGILFPATEEFRIPPTRVRAEAMALDSRVQVEDVRLQILQYFPAPALQKGLLRFVAAASGESVARAHTRVVAQDFEFSLSASGTSLRFLMSRSPKRRLYP